MKTQGWIAFVVLFLFNLTFADERAGTFGIGAKGGITSYAGDIDEQNIAAYYDFYGSYWLTNRVGLAFNYGKGFLSAAETVNENERYFKTWLWNYTTLLRFKLRPSCDFNAYLTAGFSVIDIDPKKRNGSRLPNRATGVYDKINYAVPMGLGATYYLSDVVAIDAELIYHYALTDYIDDIKAGSRHDGWTTLALGLSINFGKSREPATYRIPRTVEPQPWPVEALPEEPAEEPVPEVIEEPQPVEEIVKEVPEEREALYVDEGQSLVLEGVTFASGSTNLTLEAQLILNQVVDILKKYPSMEVEIRGFTDNTGSYAQNIKLSQRRAEAVKDYLVLNGIFPHRLKAFGFGPENPIAPNDTPEGRAKNRRIEFFRVK